MMGSSNNSSLTLLVRQITYQAIGINSYELTHPDGEELPPFTPGSHIDVFIPGGFIRQYSLCNDPSERNRYVIAVLKDDVGRGGSKSLHENVKVQDTLTISYPRNNFFLSTEAKRHLLVAGGIGVTPLKSMAHYLDKLGEDFELHYCSKSINHAAFYDELKQFIDTDRAFMHFDNGNPSDGLNLSDFLSAHESGTHVYYCGPSGFMSACSAGSKHWPKGTVHLEHFKVPDKKDGNIINEALEGASNENEIREIKINSTGEVLDLPENKSIAQVLLDSGYFIETSCEAGLCATCKIKYISGGVDHQDFILDDEDRATYLTTCVSRPQSKLLVLDL